MESKPAGSKITAGNPSRWGKVTRRLALGGLTVLLLGMIGSGLIMGRLCSDAKPSPGRAPAAFFAGLPRVLVLAHRGEHSVQRAWRQVAGAIDLIVYVEMIDETAIGGRKHRFVSHVLEVDGLQPDGGGVRTTTVFGPADGGASGRAVPLHLPERHLVRLQRVGYDPTALNRFRSVGRWPRPLDTVIGGR